MRGLIALTGASGFIGRAVTDSLLEAGWGLRLLLRNPTRRLTSGPVEVFPGALEDERRLADFVAGADAVVHCAGAIKARDREAFMAVNAQGTASLAKAASEATVPPRLLLVSSLAARQPGLSDYAASKRAGEAALGEAGSKLRRAILRPPAVYGPGDRATLPLFQQLSRGVLIAPGRADARFSLLYLADLAAAVRHLLEQPAWSGVPLELDDAVPGGYGWADLAKAAAVARGQPVRRFLLPRAALWLPTLANEALAGLTGRAPMLTRGKLRELYHQDWVAQPSQAPEISEWRPDVTFVEGFRRTVEWYKHEGWI